MLCKATLTLTLTLHHGDRKSSFEKPNLGVNEIKIDQNYNVAHSEKSIKNVSMLTSKYKGNCALAIVPIIASYQKNAIKINCLLDSGANFSVIAKSAAEKLGLDGIKIKTSMLTLSGQMEEVELETVQLEIILRDFLNWR